MTPPSGRLQVDSPPRAQLSPRTARILDRSVIGAAVVLGLVGVFVLLFHLLTDPLVDIHAYYDAATRLNAGLPLYAGQGSVDNPEFYRYPPLLAIAFRPLALLPFMAAALIWEAITIAAFVATIWLLGFRRRRTWIALGILAGPIAWSVTIGQAQVVVTLLLLMGNPAAVALAAQLKLLPVLVAFYWIGRRDWRNLGRFVAWSVALVVVQLILEPSNSLAFLGTANLGQVGDVNNLSPYAISPVLWLVFAIAGLILTLRLAPTRAGWPAAIALSVLATPRLLEYMLMTLLATLRPSDPAGPRSSERSSDNGPS
ncbi:MAG TPA: glycosyltransferase 87 family protein [Candidatus Limnocylindrales bacterium]|nr:glycosyltransferase 87 family protein [Candidatus Limnocylindrales bacterium]